MFELRQAERAERPGSGGAAFGRRRRGAGPLFSAGEGGGRRVGPGSPERCAPSRSGVLHPPPGPPTTRGEVSVLREVVTEELGVRAVPPLCVYTWGELRSVAQVWQGGF